MANGRTELDPEELHKEGCEYGRSLGKDVAYLREDVAEIKTGQNEIKEAVNRIERKLAQGEWMRSAGTVGIATVVSAIINAILPGRRP